jgi:hypothetical protein
LQAAFISGLSIGLTAKTICSESSRGNGLTWRKSPVIAWQTFQEFGTCNKRCQSTCSKSGRWTTPCNRLAPLIPKVWPDFLDECWYAIVLNNMHWLCSTYTATPSPLWLVGAKETSWIVPFGTCRLI